MKIIDPSTVTAQELVEQGVWQAFSFGPGLVENGGIAVSLDSEVGRAKASNPRTAIGMIEPLHYKIVVAEGRLDRYAERDGLTLYELADLMRSIGCENAYNLDGGSSSTLYFNGEVLNETPSSERKVSDCIFINGYRYDE
jgi:exopolysaccharide biosynthesis protein